MAGMGQDRLQSGSLAVSKMKFHMEVSPVIAGRIIALLAAL
jgi:hypothetical protein